MINRDPLGELCEDIINTFTVLANLTERSLFLLYLDAKSCSITPYYAFLRACNTGYFFLARLWNALYWTHFYIPLYLIGFAPDITEDSSIEGRRARLHAIIADTQYDNDPRVQEVKATIRALLDTYEKGKPPA